MNYMVKDEVIEAKALFNNIFGHWIFNYFK